MTRDAAARRVSVLIVDEKRHSADMLADLLRLKGHNARVAYSGPQALVIVRVWRPDVAVVDVALDGVSGAELAKRIRNEIKAPIMLVAVTEVGANDEVTRINAGAFEHRLLRPVDPDELLALLEACTNQRPPASS